ncbi:P-loop NTPase [Candidatus Micrarchaeota archaeon]|nr:P-loop NTPase [Candidatus Micrarchaeota archaeon]
MKIAVLSGKGGVGKSTVSASLAKVLSERGPVVTADCDVDTPNLGILFGMDDGDFEKEWVSTGEKAVLDKEKCIGCRKCLGICVFSAISWGEGKPEFDRLACEGCGACSLACPVGAIGLEQVENGWIGDAEKGGICIATGQLKMGEAGSGDIVDLVKKRAEQICEKIGAEHTIIDSAAGIGCPVIASVAGIDYAVAVTEPTPSAFSDLERALEVVKHFKIPYGIVINKSTLDSEFSGKMKEVAAERGAEVIGEFPYDKKFLDAAVGMKPVVEIAPEYKGEFEKILEKVGAL